MTIEETIRIRKKAELMLQFNKETGLSSYFEYDEYAEWLEDKLIKLQSQPTTTPSDDVAAGHGAC